MDDLDRQTRSPDSRSMSDTRPSDRPRGNPDTGRNSPRPRRDLSGMPFRNGGGQPASFTPTVPTGTRTIVPRTLDGPWFPSPHATTGVPVLTRRVYEEGGDVRGASGW